MIIALFHTTMKTNFFMGTYFMTKKLLMLICLLLISTSAFAFPSLQLYIPGGTYDATEGVETWIAPSAGTFEVWVLASDISAESIYNIHLTAALTPDADASAGSLEITSLDNGSVNTYTGSNFIDGTPPESDPDNQLPGHGIFPTWYVDQLVTAQTSTNSADWENVWDMPSSMPDFPEDEAKMGQIFRFSIVSTYDYVHFDAYGYLADRFTKAPFSHDAESGPSEVPEPATMLLFSLGLAGAGISRKFRSKK